VRIAVIGITESSLATGKLLSDKLEDCTLIDLRGKGKLKEWVCSHFNNYEGLIFIMATGIVFRVIADQIKSKYTDPAVVIVDDAARFAIAALSGHEGGSNFLASRVGRIINAVPVITTASDTNKKIIIGIGCRKGIESGEVIMAVKTSLKEASLSIEDVRTGASADIKREEPGLVKAFEELEIPLVFISTDRIRNFSGYNTESKTARKIFDIPGVSEPCALLVGRDAELIQNRRNYNRVTVAIAREDSV